MADAPQDIQRKLAYYQRKYELNPGSRLFAPLADLLRKSGRLEDALALVQGGLQDHPRYVSALVILGRCHKDDEDWASAKDAFLRVIAIDPDNLVALNYLARDAIRQEDWQEATGLLERVVALDPSDTEAEDELTRLRSLPVATVESVSGVESEIGSDQAGSPETESMLAPETVAITTESPPYDIYTTPRVEQLSSATSDEAAKPDEEPTLEEVVTPEEATIPAEDVTHDEAPIPVEAESPEEDPVAVPPADSEEVTVDDQPADDGIPATKTLADIYLSQGYRDRALKVLRQILDRNPQREDIREQIARIENSPREMRNNARETNEAPPTARSLDNEVKRKYFENWISRIGQGTEE